MQGGIDDYVELNGILWSLLQWDVFEAEGLHNAVWGFHSIHLASLQLQGVTGLQL